MICQDAPDAIQKAGIEALLVDQLEPAGETVAEFLGIPFICVCCAQAIHRQADVPPFLLLSYQNTGGHVFAIWLLISYWIAVATMQQVLNEYRKQWKLPIYHASGFPILNSPNQQQPAAFDFPGANCQNTFTTLDILRNASPLVGPFPFEQLTGQLLIMLHLGLTEHQAGDFLLHRSSLRGTRCSISYFSWGWMNAEAVQRLPGSPLVVEYAPQLELLAKARLTITHGGLNTVLDSLSHGVPLVAIPITYEQPGTGRANQVDR
jgi:hypothetical protein